LEDLLGTVRVSRGAGASQLRDGFVCPVHGATFNLSGQWIGGQRTSSLHSYATSYDSASGTLTIS